MNFNGKPECLALYVRGVELRDDVDIQLTYAARLGHADVVQYLLELGAKPDRTTNPTVVRRLSTTVSRVSDTEPL